MHANRVRETTTTTGTGNLTLAGAAVDRIAFSIKYAVNQRFKYWIGDTTNNVWETGFGYLSDSTTLVRERVLDNSSDTKVALTLSAGTKDVYVSPSESDLFFSADTINDFATNQYLFPLGNSENSSLALTASRVYYTSPFIAQGGEFSGLTIEVTTAQASSTARLGVYSVAGGRPSVKLGETGSLDTSTTGLKEGAFSSNIEIAPGLSCFVALISDDAITVRAFPADSTYSGLLGHDGGILTPRQSMLFEAGSGIVLPATPSATPGQREDNLPIIPMVKT